MSTPAGQGGGEHVAAFHVSDAFITTQAAVFIKAGLRAGEAVIARASGSRPGGTVRAYGEMVDVLWKGGQMDAAMKLESLWNQLAHSHEFALLCGYSMGHFYKAAVPRALHDLHTHVWADDADARAVLQ